MKWLQRDRTHLSAPYSIVQDIRGYSIWYSKGSKYGILAREIPNLSAAQEYCEQHKFKQEKLLDHLDAVDAK